MKFTAAGDALAQKRMPETYKGFEGIKDFIMQGDVRFFNYESSINYEGECYASQFSGGTYVRSNPEVFYDTLKYGFNVTNFNMNHIMDFSYGGLLKTLEYAEKAEVVHAGVGKNLAEAAAPKYIETENGRVAIISVCSSFNPSIMAGEQSRRYPGRPGINGLRVDTKYVLPKDDFDAIQGIAARLNINAYNEIIRKEGYLAPLPEDICEFGEMKFVLGDEHRITTSCNSKDLERIRKSIYEAQEQADYVLVSIHSHQISGTQKETPGEFLNEFAHFCIDNGADAIVGHGPHLLRAIEVYKERPIFYSLGDFLIQLYSVPSAPEDFYQQQNMTSDTSVVDLLKKRSADYTRGLMEEDKMLETVIPYWETDGKKLTKLILKPVKASKGAGKHIEGLPVPVDGKEMIERLAELSKPYGVKITYKDGLGVCEWQED